MEKKITVLPGDGIGPEVTEATVQVLQAIEKRFNHTFNFQYALLVERRLMHRKSTSRRNN